MEAGCTQPDQITIDWATPGRIIVAVMDGNAYIPPSEENENVGEILFEKSDEEVIRDDAIAKNDFDPGDDSYEDDVDDEADSDMLLNDDYIHNNIDILDYKNDSPARGIDMTTLARSINAALSADGIGSIGYTIAEQHEIEVTTPGAPDVLSGTVMFDAYKGFDVLVEVLAVDDDGGKTTAKTGGKIKIIEGKLVERTDEVTIINQRGRMKKLKNDIVACVKLPKAKRERGAR